jgi:hypothetical protein
VEHFVTIERAIACPRASVAVAAETAAQVLGAAGYRRGLGFGPTASYVRSYRPGWAVALAFLGAIPTLGLALLLLRVRSKDHCNVVIEDGPYGVVALVSGRVPADLPAALENASGQYVEQQSGGYQQQQQPQAMLLSPSAGVDVGPSPQAILRPSAPGDGQQRPGYAGPPAGYPQPQAPSFDPYPVPQYNQPPGQYNQPPGQYNQPPGPEWGRGPDQSVDDQPVPAPVAVRPPSKLAPPMPPDERPGPGNPVAARPGAPNAAAPTAPPGSVPGGPPLSDDDPFSSTSGRVPWVGGGRPGPLPAPPGPVPASPVSRPAGFPPPPGAPGYQPDGAPGARPDAPGRVATAVNVGAVVLRVDSGEVLEIGPFCLLGREPVARDDDPESILIRFDDPKLSVSKTHMAYGVDGQGVWVMDRNSTNGTTVIDPTGRRIPCAPGSRQYVTPGYQVQIGQRRIVIETPGAQSS